MSDTTDLLDPAVRASPYETYALMRDKNPVCRVDPGGLWALFRYRDVKAALKDHQTFSSAGFKYLLGPEWLSDSPQSESLLAMDPPEHSRLRSLVNKAFIPRVINKLVDTIEIAARDRISEISCRTEIELFEDFSFPFISRIIGKIVGFEPEMHRDIKRWVDGLTYLGPIKPEPAIHRQLEETQAIITAYGKRVIAERRRHLHDDLISRIVAAEVDGECLSDRECLSMLELLIGAGFDTTNILLTNCIRQLSSQPEMVGELYESPETLPAFIEEVMRYDPPTHALLRQTTRDVEIDGVTLPGGEFIYLMLGSAGRDELHYEHPDIFDMHREDKDHLSFGHGIHACVGMMLARMEVKIALTELIGTFRSLSCPRRPTTSNGHLA